MESHTAVGFARQRRKPPREFGLVLVLVVAVLPLGTTGCQGGGDTGFTCQFDEDCAPDCECFLRSSVSGICEFEESSGGLDWICQGTCNAPIGCPEGSSCQSVEFATRPNPADGRDRDVRVYDCVPIEGTGGAGGSGGAGGTGGSPGTTCGPLGSRLVIVLSWEAPAVELDVGGETPEVNEPSNNFGAGPPAPDKDPQCTHDGDEPTGNGFMMERVVCEPLFDPARTYTGDWTIRVDNFDDTERDYDLLATMDGVDLPGFPQSGSVDGNDGFVDIMFCVQ